MTSTPTVSKTSSPARAIAGPLRFQAGTDLKRFRRSAVETTYRWLCGFYDVGGGLTVGDLLCSPTRAQRWIPPQELQRGEVVIAVERGEDLELGLFLADGPLRALMQASSNPWSTPEARQGLCLLVEGVSHLLMLEQRYRHGLQVRGIELEIQADLDKYVVGMAEHQGPDREWHSHSLRVRRWLFRGVTFMDGAGNGVGTRYRDAHRAALNILKYQEMTTPQDRSGHHWEHWIRYWRRLYRAGLGHRVRL